MKKNYKILWCDFHLLPHIVTYRILINNCFQILTYLYRGATRLKSGQVRFQCFWAYTLTWTKKKNSMTAILLFLQLTLIWVWNINETYVFIMKFKDPRSLLPENSVRLLNPLYQFFTKVIIRNVPSQNMSNFLSVALEKSLVNFQKYLFAYRINDK